MRISFEVSVHFFSRFPTSPLKFPANFPTPTTFFLALLHRAPMSLCTRLVYSTDVRRGFFLSAIYMACDLAPRKKTVTEHTQQRYPRIARRAGRCTRMLAALALLLLGVALRLRTRCGKNCRTSLGSSVASQVRRNRDDTSVASHNTAQPSANFCHV